MPFAGEAGLEIDYRGIAIGTGGQVQFHHYPAGLEGKDIGTDKSELVSTRLDRDILDRTALRTEQGHRQIGIGDRQADRIAIQFCGLIDIDHHIIGTRLGLGQGIAIGIGPGYLAVTIQVGPVGSIDTDKHGQVAGTDIDRGHIGQAVALTVGEIESVTLFKRQRTLDEYIIRNLQIDFGDTGA